MARPQIPWTAWDKPTSPVGRDESINHGIVIPNAERLRAPPLLSFIFPGKGLVGKYSRFLPLKNPPLLRKNYLHPSSHLLSSSPKFSLSCVPVIPCSFDFCEINRKNCPRNSAWMKPRGRKKEIFLHSSTSQFLLLRPDGSSLKTILRRSFPSLSLSLFIRELWNSPLLHCSRRIDFSSEINCAPCRVLLSTYYGNALSRHTSERVTWHFTIRLADTLRSLT